MITRALLAVTLVLTGAALWLAAAPPAPAPIQFEYRPIDFQLESCETPDRHAPETMAGGVAVFDYNNDGKLDIFFTNGADINTLKKNEPKYSNRLFENDGRAFYAMSPRRLALLAPASIPA